MNEYEIGRDIGDLFSRVKYLEERSVRYTCEASRGGEAIVRQLTTDELESERGTSRKGHFCVYAVAGFVGNPCKGIRIGDFICVSPCPPCPDISILRIVDAHGKLLCTLRVRIGAAGGCDPCPPGGKKFTWAA